MTTKAARTPIYGTRMIGNDDLCIWEDCDQTALYCAGHAREFVDPLGKLSSYDADQQRIAELEAELRRIAALGDFLPTADVAYDATRGARRVLGLKGKKPPYPEFCRHPDKCAGIGSCPRDPTCAD